MTVTPSSPQTVSAELLAAGFDSALLSVISRFGENLALPAVFWSVIKYPDGLVLEGHLSAADPSSIPTCEAWVRALGMSEFSWLAETGQRSWHLERGAWTIELSCD